MNNQGYTLKDYLSAYEGDAPISIKHNHDGEICHGVPLSIIRDQSWYKLYENKDVISFKVVKDIKADDQYVLLLLM